MQNHVRLFLLMIPLMAMPSATLAKQLNIVLIAGPDSHYYGAHDFEGGVKFLAKALKEASSDISVKTAFGGWPEDSSIFDNADAVIIYSDGLAKHILNQDNKHVLEKLHEKGVGIGFLHYACTVEKDDLGPEFLEWIGGYYEPYWSVNPKWVAGFRKLPKHPVTRGVRPFTIYDEWYYHMRFRVEMKDVTPLLTAVPPEKTRQKKDGAHSGNPHVRARTGMPEHVAWVALGDDKQRGFGLTGLHYHWNLAHPYLQKFMLNACVWLAGGKIPEDGLPIQKVTFQDMVDINPGEPDARWNREVKDLWEAKIDEWNQLTP